MTLGSQDIQAIVAGISANPAALGSMQYRQARPQVNLVNVYKIT